MANAYFECRKRSKMSRQTAAEQLGVSDSSLASYEQGTVKRVPADVVMTMAKIYKAPELRRSYCKECPLGMGEQIATEIKSVAGTVLHFIKSQEQLQQQSKELIAIGMDDTISRDEEYKLRSVVKSLEGLCYALSAINLVGEQHGR